MANTYVKIATVTVTSPSTTTNIQFASIPSTYTDLVVKLSSRGSAASPGITAYVNGNNSNGSFRTLTGSGSAAFSSSASGYMDITVINGSGTTASTFTSTDIYFPNYRSSANKSFSVDAVTENNATAATAGMYAILWSNTSAITQLDFTINTGFYDQYSTATLYGISKS